MMLWKDVRVKLLRRMTRRACGHAWECEQALEEDVERGIGMIRVPAGIYRQAFGAGGTIQFTKDCSRIIFPRQGIEA